MGRCSAHLASQNQIALMDLMGKCREQSLCEINSCRSGARRCVHPWKQGNLLLYSSCSWSHHLVKPAAVSFLLHDPSIFYKFSGVKWRCGKEPSALYLSNYNPSRNMILLGFTIFLGSKSMISMAFSTIIVFTLWMKGPVWVGVLLTSQCIYPHYT